MLRIVVCVKQVLDPEAPASSFRVDPEARRVIPPKGTPPVLNPFDENALEAALRIKRTREARITVISMGKILSRPVLRKSLAAGADELVLIEDNTFEDLDSYSSADVLSKAIKKTGEFDLVLCGRQAADTDAGQVGSVIAEMLGIPGVTVARNIEVLDSKVKVERITADGYEVIEAPLPALVTVSNEIGELRSATMTALIAAQKKSITVWNAGDIGATVSELRRNKLYRLFQPVRDSRCEFVNANSAEEAASNLALRLRDSKVL